MDAIIRVGDRADWIAALTAAAELGRPVKLLTSPGFAVHGGLGLFMALCDDARAAAPTARFRAVLDCGDDWARAHAAIARGVDGIRLDAPAPVFEKLRSLVAETGAATVLHGVDWLAGKEVLDLTTMDQDSRSLACQQWLEARSS